MKPRFFAKPMFGKKSRLPAVECSWGIESLQVTTEKVKLVARWLFEGAAHARIDAALYRMGRSHEEREAMIHVLAALRGPLPAWHEPGAPVEERPTLTEDGRENVWVTSVFADEPRVDFQFGRMQQAIPPEDAEQIADLLYTTALQAETDGGLWLALEVMGIPSEGAARILQGVRSERHTLRSAVKRYERE